jgi:hypothetical protein
MRPAGFETTILASERPQDHALDRAATGMGKYVILQDRKKEHSTKTTFLLIYCILENISSSLKESSSETAK